MKAKEQEQCGARCPDVKGEQDFVCDLRVNHPGKHSSDAGGYWSDLGAERIRVELARLEECKAGF